MIKNLSLPEFKNPGFDLSNGNDGNNSWTAKLIIALLVASIVIVNAFVIFTEGSYRVFFFNWTINLTSGIALAITISLVLVNRRIQKIQQIQNNNTNPHISSTSFLFLYKTYVYLCVGLALWFIAEILWTYYQIGLRINTPFPSIADAFWISGYAFCIYFAFQRYKHLKIHLDEYLVIIVLVFLAFVVNFIVSATSLLSSNEEHNYANLLISLAYPILDGILFLPSFLIFLRFYSQRQRGLKIEPMFSHWLLISIAAIFLLIGDSGFAYVVALDITTVIKEEWIWDMFYNVAYLSVSAASLLYVGFQGMTRNQKLAA